MVTLPKAHLTSRSRMSGSRWVTTQSWLSESWRSLLYSSSVYSCHLFLIPSASVAAAAAKSLQSCPTPFDSIDGSPPGSLVPGVLQARTLEWVAVSFSNAWKWKVKGKSLSRVWLLVTPWTAAYQAPQSTLSQIISVLYCAHLCMKCSLGISDFLEEISSLSHSVVFLYFFALITEEGFLISPWYSLELCIQIGTLHSPDVKNWLTGKDPDAGKDWRWEEKWTAENEMVGWHHWLNGHEFK